MRRSAFLYTSLFILSLVLSGCYRMPNDDDCCLIPTTNNPDVYKDRSAGTNIMPSAGF